MKNSSFWDNNSKTDNTILSAYSAMSNQPSSHSLFTSLFVIIMAHLSETVFIKNTSLIVKFEFDHSSKNQVQNPFLAKAELDFACSYLPVSVFFCEN